MTDHAAIKAQILNEARAAGFDDARITAASLPEHIRDRLNAFIASGYHGDMAWLEDRKDERAHPQTLWPHARSVIMLAMNYGPDEDPMAKINDPSTPYISVYAANKDYHDVIKKRLKRLGRWMAETFSCELKVFVDTAPVMEKPLAQQAGLGWQGKHTNLVSRTLGSWTFLGAIYTTLDLPPDETETDHCGSCRQCLDICPTNAFPAPYQLDASRCISYLTIEHKGSIPVDLRKGIGSRIYGCDDCLAVCPWNKFAQSAHELALRPKQETSDDFESLARMDDASFRARFSGSPVKRIGRARFIRNVMISIGNSADPMLAQLVIERLEDESPLVRGAAVWAARQLLSSARFAKLREEHQQRETDPDAQSEWDASV